jgi:hypothetical protein
MSVIKTHMICWVILQILISYCKVEAMNHRHAGMDGSLVNSHDPYLSEELWKTRFNFKKQL